MVIQKVSLYIPCYNAARYLDNCLKGVLSQTYPIDEIFIIDDGSVDNTIEIAAKYPVRIIRHRENRGLAAARNSGILNAKNEYVASLDSDCLPQPDWLEILMSNFTEEKIAGVGGLLNERYTKGTANKWRTIHMQQTRGDKRIYDDTGIFGNNNVMKKNALIKAGLYDERFKTNAEDTHISVKLRGLGYTLIYEPRAVVWHLKTDTISSVMDAYWRYLFFGHSLPINAIQTMRAMLINFKVAYQQILADITNRRFVLLILDFSLPFYRSLRDIRAYFNRHSLGANINNLDISCPCGGKTFRHFAMLTKTTIYGCLDCGLMQTYPLIYQPSSYCNSCAVNSPEWAIKLRGRWVKKDIKIIQRYKTGNDKLKVLEIGFGDGLFLKAITEEGWEAYGVDINRANCKYAKEVLGVPRIYEEELLKVRFADKSFDVVMLAHTIEHIKPLKETLGEILRILKPCGLLIIFTPNVLGLFIQVSGLRKFLKSMTEDSGHIWHFIPKTLRQIISNSGFKVLRLSLGSMHHGSFKPTPKGIIKFTVLIFAKIFNMGDNILLIARKPE